MSPDPSTVRRPFPILPGLGGVARGEVTRWFGRRGLVHLIAWTVVIQWFLYVDTVHDSDAAADWRGFDLLVHLLWIGVPLTSIAIAQNALVEERRDDTAPWVLSKPVSRSAYVIGKILGTTIGIVAIGVVLQGAIAYAWLPEVDPETGLPIARPELGTYVAVPGILALVSLMFVAMTIFLTTIVPWRGPAAAVGLFVWFAVWTAPHEIDAVGRFTIGGLVKGELDQPRRMKPLAEYLVFETPLEPTSSIVWTAIATIVFITLGALVYRRQQF
jgi:ABC-type transport system involved in multi-copper enzyme maturation permease subunit